MRYSCLSAFNIHFRSMSRFAWLFASILVIAAAIPASPQVAAAQTQANSPTFVLSSFLNGNASDVAVGDLNGDGALDLVLGNYGAPSQVYLNDGTGHFPAPFPLPDSSS